jgi:ABC-type amino acid transport substrate-binding protein
MKKLLLPSLLMLVNIVTSAQQLKGDSWASVKLKGSGKVAVLFNQQPGLISKMPDGSMKGVCVDILLDFQKFVLTKYNKKISIEYVGEQADFPRFLSTIQSTDDLLGVTNTSITDERKKIMKFTPSFMNNQVILLTHQSVPTLKNLSDLPVAFKGFTAQVISESTHAREMEKIKKDFFPGLKIEGMPSGDVIIKNLSTNKQVFSIIDFTEFIAVVKNRMPVKKHDVEIGIPETLGFIMSKRTDWDGPWNEFLTPEYKKSVRYKEIIAQNLGASFLRLVH